MNCIICSVNIPVEFLNELLSIYQSQICDDCYSKIKKIKTKNICPQCQKSQSSQNVCQQCLSWNQNYPILKNSAIFKYNPELSKYMHRFKYVGDYQLKNEFSKTVRKKLNKIKKRFDLVVAIPVSKTTYEKRLFNQVSALFKIQDDILMIEKNVQMSGLSHQERTQQKILFQVQKNVVNKKSY